MSLHELVGPSIHLKLGIREGHGFGFLKNPMVIVAGTGGIFLETDVVPPSPTPLFHIDLVWETDKINLRRFRTSNTPIKLECFTIGPNNQRDSIGSILLNIKSAQVVHGSQLNVSEKWYKLIGVPHEAKALQPELLLNLTIQEPNSQMHALNYTSLESGEPNESVALKKNNVAKTVHKKQRQLPSSHPSLLPLLEYKQGYIHLGPDSLCSDTFFLTLSVRRAQEMELLLQSHQYLASFDSDAKPFLVSFSLMGQKLSTKSFGDNNWQKELTVNEDIVLPIRSSLSVLHSYLQENPSTTLQLLYCGQEIAAAELHIRSLVPTNDVQSFTREFCGESSFTHNCVLVSSSSGSIPLQDGLQPSIEVTTKLKLTASRKLFPSKPAKQSSDASLQTNTNIDVVEDLPSRSESRQSQDTFIVTTQNGPSWVPVASGLVQSNSTYSKETTGSKTTGMFRNFIPSMTTVKVELNHIIFHVPPKSDSVRFLFNCPNSSMVTAAFGNTSVTHIHQPIMLEDVWAKISGPSLNSIHIHLFETTSSSCGTSAQHFASASICADGIDFTGKKESLVSTVLKSSTSEQVVGVLISTVSCEKLCEETNTNAEKGEESSVPQIPLNSAPILPDYSPQPVLNFNDLSSKNSTSVPKRGELTSDERPQVAEVHHLPTYYSSLPQMNTKSSGIPALPSEIQTTDTSTLPLNTGAAYKIVEELEDWKEKQQEIFLAELKRKETKHISQITDEWTNQTKTLNIELEKKQEECKALVETLKNAKKDLKDRLKICTKRELELQRKAEELNSQYNLRLEEFTLATKKLDEIAKQKISLLESKCSNLEERLKDTLSENEKLHHQLRQKAFDTIPPGDGPICGMSHNQVSKLLLQVDQLEEKLNASLQSNVFFKEQWGRAVRELNQSKLQFSKNANVSNDKGLENLLKMEEAELQEDQKTLELLRRDLSKFK